MNNQPVAPGRRSLLAPFWGQSVRTRILAGSAGIMLLAVAAGFLMFWQMNRLVAAVNTLEIASNRVATATEVRHASTGLLAAVSRLLPVEDSELFVAEVSDSLESLQTSQQALGALLENTEDPETLNALARVSERVQNIINVTGTMVRQADNEQWPSVRVRVGVLNRDQQQVVNEVNNLVEQVRSEQDQALARVAAARRAAILYPALVGLFAMGLAAVSVSRITRSIAGPVERLTASAARLATGAFEERVPVERRDEMGQLADAFNKMAAQLESYYSVLEERVAERTRDLALAAEVGRRLSQVQDLDQLVREAVERIRERFDLYYVQLYLADEQGQTLTLLAGTGEIGEQLVERGHRLPIDFGSINGMAAREREAIVIPRTAESSLFRPNPLLPRTRSEMAIPLLSGARVIGVLDLQSRKPAELSPEILPAFEVVAGQLAIAIGNARLFDEVNEARAELAQRRQAAIRQGWDAFLNAIQREEVLRAEYELPARWRDESVSEPSRLTTSITLDDEPIGVIEVEGERDLRWSGEQIEIVNSVAQQVAQQVENLRLLAETQRYREEAEQAVRRLTREGWEGFQRNREMEQLSYGYDGQRVHRSAEVNSDQGAAVKQPLLVQGETIGELVVTETDHPERAATLVAAVADRLSAHLENLRLSQQTEAALATAQQRSQELATLNRIVTEIGATLDLSESLQIVVSELVQVTAGNQARVALLNEGGTTLTIVAEELDPGHDTGSALGLEIPVAGNLLTQEVLATRQPVLATDPQHDPRLAPMHTLFREQGIEAMLLLPILAGKEVVGTVGIDVLEAEQALTEEEQRLAGAIVLQVATAIQNARLFEQSQLRAEELAVLNEMGRALTALTSVEPVLETLYQYTGRLMDAQNFYVSLYDSEKERLSFPLAVDENERVDYPARRYGAGITEYVIEAQEPVLIRENVNAFMAAAGIEQFGREASSWLGVPILLGERVLGVIGVQSFTEENRYDQNDRDILASIANQAAIALQNAELFEEIRRRVAETRILYETTRAINTARSYQEVLQALRGQTLLEAADHLSINYYDRPLDDNQLPQTVHILARDSGLPAASLAASYAFADFPDVEALHTDGPVYFEDVANDPLLSEPLRRLLQDLQGESALFVPLIAGGQWIGFINAVYWERVEFPEREVNLLSTLIGQASVAIQGLRLLEEAEKRARREQLLREITASVRSVTDVELIMKTAAREVGEALGRETYVYLDDGDGERAAELPAGESTSSSNGEERR